MERTLRTLEEMVIDFQALKKKSGDPLEHQIYDKFIDIIKDLIQREFSSAQLDGIVTELKTLNFEIEAKNRKKYFKQNLAAFQKFLKSQHSLVVKGHYLGIGIGLGIVLGSIFSILFQSSFGAYALIIGVIGGMALGGFLGSLKDTEAKKQGRVLKIE